MEEKSKKLGMWNIVGLGLGGAIGTGIFVMLGYGIAYTGRSVTLVCMVGCVFMLLAYWYNLAMPSMFVLRGGDYSMKSMLFNPLMTGVAAWFTVIQGFSFSGYSLALTQYLEVLFPVIAKYETIIAIAITTLFFLTTIKGSRLVTIIQNVVTVVLVVAVALFVAFGIFKVDARAFFSNNNPDGPFFYGGFGGFISALAIMGFACQGTTMGPVAMAAVTEKPKRTIPVAILIITAILAVIYGLMAYVASGVLPYDQIAGQNISVTAEAIFPRPLFLFFVVGGGIGAVASSLLCGLDMVRYPLIQVAEDGWLPSVFKKTTSDGYPYVTYIFHFLIAIFPLLLGMGLDTVVSLTMIPTMLMNVYVNIACITLPNKYPEQWDKRSIKWPTWLWNLCSVLGAACALIVAFNLFKDLTLTDSIVCVILCVALVVLSFVRLKQGAVKAEKLEEIKQETVRQAIADDVN